MEDFGLIKLEIGRRIREARVEAGLRQAELAERMGMKRAGLSRLENGATCSIEALYAAAAALGVPVQRFLP